MAQMIFNGPTKTNKLKFVVFVVGTKNWSIDQVHERYLVIKTTCEY